MKLTQLCKENGASILSGLGVVGVVGTAVLAAKATPKAICLLAKKEMYKQENYGERLTRFEKALAMAPAYIPAILMGTATAGCILGANHINQNKQAALMAAYMCLDSEYKAYQQKTKDIFGEAGEKKVREELEKDKFIHDKFGTVDEKRLFYDEFSDRYFEMSLYELQVATYEFNRLYNHLGEMALNEFYDFINMKPIDLGDKVGWNGIKDWECCGFSWIHVHLEKMETPDGLEVLAIKFDIEPSKDFREW